jgi:hypothetical protein
MLGANFQAQNSYKVSIDGLSMQSVANLHMGSVLFWSLYYVTYSGISYCTHYK